VPDPNATANILPSSNPHLKQINMTNSGRLHSPILDLGGQATRKGKNQFSMTENMSPEVNTGHSNSISRNGLYSPLLDGTNHFVNPYPGPGTNANNDDEEVTNIQANPITPNPAEKSRLHSPVLDGPISGSFSSTYIEENFSQEEEYESLRSPLLKAKVPLPEKNQIHENATRQENRFQSVLESATTPAAKTNANANSIGSQDALIAPLSITGINKLSKASASGSRSGGAPTSRSFLPTEEEISPISNIENSKIKSPLNKMLLTSLIFLALGFKIWYLVSLGSAAFGSAPFVFDQGGQIIVLLLILVLVLY
jgi:hypothetical protein